MSYHKSIAGVGWVSIVPSGAYPDPVHLAEIESLDLNANEEFADVEDASGDVIDRFRTKRVIEGSISLKDFSGSLLAAATSGVTISTGGILGFSHPATAIPTTPFQITVTEGATFATDLGVIDLNTNKLMTADATATGTGVYAVNTATGVYTFNTADVGHSVQINYRATKSTSGITAAVASATSSGATYYGLHCYQTTQAKAWGIYIPAAQIGNLAAKFSKKGWSDTTLKFTATKDSSGKFSYIYTPE